MKTTGKFRVCNSFAINEFQVWNRNNYSKASFQGFFDSNVYFDWN